MIEDKEKWKNKLAEKRIVIIELVNRLMRMATDKNKDDINKQYDELIKHLGGKNGNRTKLF